MSPSQGASWFQCFTVRCGLFLKKGREQGWQFAHYCVKEHIVWSYKQAGHGPGAQGVPAESPRRRGSSHGCAVHYLQGKMKRQKNKSVMRGADGSSGCHTDLCTLQVSGHLLMILWGNFMWPELSLNPSVCRVPPTPDPVTLLKGS